MSIPTGFKMGDIAVVAVDGPVNWQRMFEEEHHKRRSLEGQLGNALASVREMKGAQTDLTANAVKASRLNARVDDMRRGIAARMLSALIIREGCPQGVEIGDMACRAVDCADELIEALLMTRPVDVRKRKRETR